MKLFFTLFFSFILYSLGSAQSNAENYLDNTLIIKFKTEKDAYSFRSKAKNISLLSEYGISGLNPIWSSSAKSQLKAKAQNNAQTAFNTPFDGLDRIFTVSYTSEIDPKTLGAKLTRLPEIEYAEPRYLYYTSELLTNDPIQNDFVNYHSFLQAWDISTSSSDVIISIVDSGVNYEHEDLENKQWLNLNEIPNNGIDDDNNGFVDDYLGWDFWENGFTEESFVSDNDPFARNSDHGTHVAGIATADPNNGKGLAGTGFNARYMAVKAGGPPDNPSTTADERRSVGFGYEGILYSYLMGAQIINCSWGGPGFSLFGQDVVNMVTEGGALIIAAAGNDNTEDPHYPSGYENVFSVGSVESNGVRSDFSNYGFEVDVFATGIVRSSNGVGEDGYATYGGTSMSSPVVAGLAALLKTEYPFWDAERIKAQIRSSAFSIEANNSSDFEFKLGTGSVNAERALSTPLPGIKIDSVHYLNENDLPIDLGQSGKARFFLSNSGQSGLSLSMKVTPLNPGLTFLSTETPIGTMPSGSVKTIELPIQLEESIIQTLSSNIRVEFFDNSVQYIDFDFIEFNELQFDFSSVNNVALSLSPNGRIGFYDAATGTGGVGFVPYPDTANFLRDNLLYEGGVIMEANQKIVNNVRGFDGVASNDFTPLTSYQVFETSDNLSAIGTSIFEPISSASLDNVEISVRTTAFNDAEVSNSLILSYTIRNTSSTLSLSEVYFGVFNDWDIGDFNNNNVFYNDQKDILIIEEDGDTGKPVVAVTTFANTSSVLGIDNNYEGTLSPNQFSLADGFSFAEKRNALKAGINNPSITNADISTVVATGPYFIPPRESISIGFIYSFGDTEAQLIEQIDNARTLSIIQSSSLNSNSDNEFPTSTSLFQNYPNPFNPSTTIQFHLEKRSDVKLDIYDSIGRKVRSIIDSNLLAGIHNYSISLNELSSGIYFAVLGTDGKRELIKLTLIK
ncbi:MAG: hypothetical protein BalsKO_25620 [Balneolaceae bacterium]